MQPGFQQRLYTRIIIGAHELPDGKFGTHPRSVYIRLIAHSGEWHKFRHSLLRLLIRIIKKIIKSGRLYELCGFQLSVIGIVKPQFRVISLVFVADRIGVMTTSPRFKGSTLTVIVETGVRLALT